MVQNTSKNIGSKRSLAVTSNVEKNMRLIIMIRVLKDLKKRDDFHKGLHSGKLGCLFYGEKGHDSLFNCSKIKSASM